MSKLFYDRFMILEEVEIELRKMNLSKEERQEMDRLIDETLHHRVMGRILTYLPRPYHAEFLDRFHKSPYDEALVNYLNEKIETSVEQHVKDEVEKVKKEILEDIRSSKRK